MQPYTNQHTEINEPQPLKGIQILLVEDEPDVAALLLFVLQAAGSTVELCTEAEAALLVLESFQPDILISNIKLPLHDGIWLIGQIRNHLPQELQQLPAIGVTSYDREVSAACALKAGFDCFLSKLDSPDVIVKAISTLVTSPPASIQAVSNQGSD